MLQANPGIREQFYKENEEVAPVITMHRSMATSAQSGIISVNNVGNKSQKPSEQSEDGGNSQIDPLDYIKPELHRHLEVIESRLQEKIGKWKQREKLIECAAFCEIIFERKWFVEGATRIKSLNNFALGRYGIDITNQLKAGKKEDRNTHKVRLLRFFK
ncbi:MAG: hypothetical protein ICV66_11565 [Chitinophagaceae bacterium]|nr:hypothetical protein [Chitinophagaceae bacterium]